MHIVQLLWVGVILVLTPVQALRSRRKLQQFEPTRIQIYVSMVFGLTLLGTITLLIDSASGGMGIQAAMNLRHWTIMGAWAAGALLTCSAIWFGGILQRKLSHRPLDEVLSLILPRTAAERKMFLIVSMVAGVVEEYVMRGFCLLVLTETTGSIVVSFVLVTLGFAAAHIYQGPWAALRTGLLGAVLTVPVIATSTLLPSMLAHAGTDILAGVFGNRLLVRWNLLQESWN